MCNTQKNSLLPKQKLHPKRWSQGTIRLCGHTTQHKTSTYNFVAPSLHNQVSTSQYHKRLTSHNFTTVETVALLGCGKRIMPFRRNTMFPPSRSYYRGADKSLARPWTYTSYKVTATKLTTLYQYLRRKNNSNILLLFVRRTSWYSVVNLVPVACIRPGSG